MKRFSPIYYVLFMLLVFGAFASMAQNDYGIKIVGIVAAAFSLLFTIQFLLHLKKKNRNNFVDLLELGSLVLLASILAMRVYYIRFQFVETVFGVAGTILISAFVIRLLKSWTKTSELNKVLALLVASFYGSIIFYTISMVTVPFIPVIAEPMGGIAFALVLSFCFWGYRRQDLLVEGEKTSAFKYVLKFKDQSIVLLTLFVLFTAYLGLTKIGVLPKMYSDEYPQAYFELVKQAEAGEEKPVDGKYKHEEFKEMYDQFVSRNTVADQK
jgi:hypothetical protein